jgi:glutathione S-transferase
MMDFYMTPGSCSTGIHILLEELGLVFSARVVSLPAGDTRKPDFLALNPKGTIPVLVREDGRPLTDFVSIAWWLALTYPGKGLLPAGADAQADVLDLMTHIVGTVHGQGYTRVFVPERYMQREDDRVVVETQGRRLVQEGLRIVADRLEAARPTAAADEGYLFGRFSIADAALFYTEFWADRIGLKMPEACRAHYELMLTRPMVRQVLMEEGYRP